MRCLGTATGDSFDDASEKINHAVGMSRGLPCGKEYGCIVEIKEDKPVKTAPKPIPPTSEPSTVKSDNSKKETKDDSKKEPTVIDASDPKPAKSKKKTFFK